VVHRLESGKVTDATDPGDTSYDRMFVAMKTDATGVVSFNYGKFGIPLNTTPPRHPIECEHSEIVWSG